MIAGVKYNLKGGMNAERRLFGGTIVIDKYTGSPRRAVGMSLFTAPAHKADVCAYVHCTAIRGDITDTECAESKMILIYKVNMLCTSVSAGRMVVGPQGPRRTTRCTTAVDGGALKKRQRSPGGRSSVASPAITRLSQHTSLTAAFQLPSPSRKGVGRHVHKGVDKVLCGSRAL